MTLTLDTRLIQEVDAALDGNVSDVYKRSPLAQDWARVTKAGEEAGEAISCLISYTGQNPRKPQVAEAYGDMLKELADTALAGIYAIQHFTKDIDATMEIVSLRLSVHHSRLCGEKP